MLRGHMKCCPSAVKIFLLKWHTIPYLVRNIWSLVRNMWLPSRCTSHSPSAPYLSSSSCGGFRPSVEAFLALQAQKGFFNAVLDQNHFEKTPKKPKKKVQNKSKNLKNAIFSVFSIELSSSTRFQIRRGGLSVMHGRIAHRNPCV